LRTEALENTVRADISDLSRGLFMKPTLVLCLLGFLLSLPVTGAEWKTSLDAAKAEARRDNKLVLLDFTGSDWCPPCIRMKKDTLDQKAFLDYAARNLVLVELDFPQRKTLPIAQRRANSALQSRYGVDVFPTFVVLSAEGKELGRHLGYLEGGPPALIRFIEGLRKKNPGPVG
jgi:thioredoxin-related protein